FLFDLPENGMRRDIVRSRSYPNLFVLMLRLEQARKILQNLQPMRRVHYQTPEPLRPLGTAGHRESCYDQDRHTQIPRFVHPGAHDTAILSAHNAHDNGQFPPAVLFERQVA
ncbi:MAG TPA: hypothetical protein PLZ55_09690, partial [bacterium]|nr:hypothetical protein [bacterium]